MSQLPILPHNLHVKSLAGQEALPGAWAFAQSPHALHVGSGGLMFFVAVVVGKTEIISSVC